MERKYGNFTSNKAQGLVTAQSQYLKQIEGDFLVPVQTINDGRITVILSI